jgi:serine/threonine protein phosphatase PrpC
VSATVEMAAATHRGRVRTHNEDAVVAEPRVGLAVVADGMGGHNAGEVASRMAVEAIQRGLEAATQARGPSLEPRRAESLVAALIEQANDRVHECGRARTDYAGMGTTLVVGLWYEGKLTVGNVGDSRLYRLRAGTLEQLTRDHTVVQEQVERGWLTPEAARDAANRSILTRAVGCDSQVSADLATYDTLREDTYLLCSDGLTEMLGDREIADLVLRYENRIQDAAEDLVEKANARGGVDNISVVLVRVAEPGEPKTGAT